jgi:hypothetical protein
MSKAEFIGNFIENNGKTIKENNLEIKHNIPLGELVEIITWDKESEEKYGGLRLFVVEHERDVDGTPLYGLSWDIKLIGKTQEEWKEMDPPIERLIKFANRHNVSRRFSKGNLKVINRKKKCFG